MTRRDRLTAIYRGQAPDRPAVRLWRAQPGVKLRHPAYEPVLNLAIERADICAHAHSPFHLQAGALREKYVHVEERPTEYAEWIDVVITYNTPEGPLREVHRRSTRNKPGYEVEHPIKEPSDIRKMLSIPYEPYPFSREGYDAKTAQVGDAGIVIAGLDHAAYGLSRLIGSENFGFWSVECPDLIMEAVEVYAKRLRDFARQWIEAGVRGVFGWVGPELFIPPLMSPAGFRRYSIEVDKPLIDLIHNAGGQVWVHCHGRMRAVIEGFVEMGVDVLNPIEPPPMGDVTVAEAFEIVGRRMGLEGGIETHDLMTATREQLQAKIHQDLREGAGKRFIYCPSSGFDEDAEPTPRHIDNLLYFVEESVRFAESLAK